MVCVIGVPGLRHSTSSSYIAHLSMAHQRRYIMKDYTKITEKTIEMEEIKELERSAKEGREYRLAMPSLRHDGEYDPNDYTDMPF